MITCSFVGFRRNKIKIGNRKTIPTRSCPLLFDFDYPPFHDFTPFIDGSLLIK